MMNLLTVPSVPLTQRRGLLDLSDPELATWLEERGEGRMRAGNCGAGCWWQVPNRSMP